MFDDIETIAANSFRNFHAKGFDYLCIKRTSDRTLKVYFFDGALAQQDQVVIPHNHRYGFRTTVLAGEVVNREFSSIGGRGWGKAVRFDYRTPLNGGSGFTAVGEDCLYEISSRAYQTNQSYWSDAEDIHTIRITQPGTVLLLDQGPDEVPLDQPTQAWRFGSDREPPNLSGLYDRMTYDHLSWLLRRTERLLAERFLFSRL